MLYAAIGAVLGGRIGYCLFYNFSEVSRHPLEIFAIWHGGMASHGGILRLVTAILTFAWKRGPPPIFLYAAVASGPLGIALGRWQTSSTKNCGKTHLDPAGSTVSGREVPRHPSQLYAAGTAYDPSLPGHPSLPARPLLFELVKKTLDHFREAIEYTLSLPAFSVRLRLACLWPVLIGLETLLLLVSNDHWLDPAKVSKIRRGDVYRIIAFSVPLVTSNRLLRFWMERRIAEIEARMRG